MTNYKRKLKPRFYIFLAILIALIGGLVYWLWPSKLVSVNKGTIEYNQNFEGVIVRKEVIHREDNFGKINMLVGEGKTVAKGTKIAEVFQWDYSDRMTDELTDIQNKIYEEQTNLIKDVVNPELNGIRDKINAKLGEIKQVVEGESKADLLQLEQQLKEFKKEESALMKKLTPSTNAKLNELYKQEKAIKDRIDKSKKDAIADEAGIVSYYFDGAESSIKAETVENLSKTDINNIIAGKLPKTGNDLDGGKPIYRLIDSHNWYVTFLGPKEGVKELIIDQEYEVTFEGVYDKPYKAKLVSNRNADGNTIYVFQFDEDVSPLISTRSAKIKVHKTFEGYKIKSRAIKEQNGVQGVYVKMSYGKTFVKVSTIVNDGRHAIVEFVDTKMEDPIKIFE